MTQIDAATGIERALQHLANQEPVLALRVLDRVSWLDLGWPEYWRVRAEAFAQMGDAKQSAASAKEGLVEDPDNLPLIVLHVRALAELGELDKAQYALQHGLRLSPGNLELQQLAGALELETDLRPAPGPLIPRAPLQTIPDAPESARGDWKTAKDWRSGRPMFNDHDASAIKRAFRPTNPTNPTLPSAPSRRRADLSFLIPLGFFLVCAAFVGYWLLSHAPK